MMATFFPLPNSSQLPPSVPSSWSSLSGNALGTVLVLKNRNHEIEREKANISKADASLGRDDEAGRLVMTCFIFSISQDKLPGKGPATGGFARRVS